MAISFAYSRKTYQIQAANIFRVRFWDAEVQRYSVICMEKPRHKGGVDVQISLK
jgi:hypothetical protein